MRAILCRFLFGRQNAQATDKVIKLAPDEFGVAAQMLFLALLEGWDTQNRYSWDKPSTRSARRTVMGNSPICSGRPLRPALQPRTSNLGSFQEAKLCYC